MEPVTIALLIICGVMLAIIIWLIVKKWNNMSPEKKEQLGDKGIEFIRYLKTAYTNDGKIDPDECKQIMYYLADIISFLTGITVSAVKTKTGTEEILTDQNE